LKEQVHPLLLVLVLMAVGLAGCDLNSAGNVAREVAGEERVATLQAALDQAKYAGQVVAQTTTLLRSQDNLEQLLGTPELGDVRWTGSVRAQVAVIGVVCQQLQGIDAPTGFAPVRQAIDDACGTCRQTVDVVLDGIDNLDAGAINQAVEHGLSCTAKFKENTALLESVVSGLEAKGLDLPDLSTPVAASPPTINAGSNLRAGPGTDYERVGGVRAGTVVAVVGRNQAGDWLAIESQGLGQVWIAAFLVDNSPDLEGLPVLPAP